MTTMMTKQCRSDEHTESKCSSNYDDSEEIGKRYTSETISIMRRPCKHDGDCSMVTVS